MKPTLLTRKLVARWIPPRPPDSHKGTFGHVLVVAGSAGMSGAGILASSGALRGGSGLTTLAVPKSLQSIAARRGRPEAMTLGAPEISGAFPPAAASFLLKWMASRKITSVAIGPGLGRAPGTLQFVRRFLAGLKISSPATRGVVLDADGFLAFKEHPRIFKALGLPIVVTPHPGELADFTSTSVQAVERDRIQSAVKFAKLYRVVCVLKGHQTVISDGNAAYLNTTGNAGMATGGSGDVLSGLIAAWIGQIPEHDLLKCACIGAYAHGCAGDLAKREKTEISLLAGDIAEKIPQAFQTIFSPHDR